MMRTPLLRRTLAISCACVFAHACTPDGGDDGGDSQGEPAAVDDFPTAIPAPSADMRVIEFPEQIIEPTTEKQLCYFLEPEKEDIFAGALESFQGKFGHHMILFRTLAPEPPGTVRDCTSLADMVNLLPVISSINFGLEAFPPNTALRVPAGTQMVVQQHYLNTSDAPIRVRDVLHLTLRDEASITTFAGFYGLSEVDFQLTTDDTVEQTVKFSCATPRDMNVLLMGPHMHEWGVRTDTSIVRVADGSSEEVLNIDPWRAEFRDSPPVRDWTLEAPLALKQGDEIRTTCVFKNTSGRVLEFPSEMCATYGYYFPAPDGSDVWTCDGSSF